MLKCRYRIEIKEVEESYNKVIFELTRRHIEFLVYNTEYMLQSDFNGIKNIVIPTMIVISKKVLEKIRDLLKHRKNIYFIGRTLYASLEEGMNDDLRDILYDIENVKSEIDIERVISLENHNFDSFRRIG